MVRLLDSAHSLYASPLFFLYSSFRQKNLTSAAAYLYKCVKLLSRQMFKAFEIFMVQRTVKDVKLFK